MKDGIKVSVFCITYNHEKYIAQTLESVINQKTNFDYEIIVHDDCSTDNTANIIREYEKKYPRLIIPIYQSENQYNNNKNYIHDFLLPKARGEYFAICEGDDYWCDESKLQKQAEFLDSHSDYSLCVHKAQITKNDKKYGVIAPKKRNATLTCEDFILGGGGFVATNSIFSRMEYLYELPNYFKVKNIDYVLQIYLSGLGKSYYSSECMSVYRTGVEGSWTSVNSTVEKETEHILSMNKFMDIFDEETKYKYHEVVAQKKLINLFDMYMICKDYKKIYKEPFKAILHKKGLVFNVKVIIKRLVNK